MQKGSVWIRERISRYLPEAAQHVTTAPTSLASNPLQERQVIWKDIVRPQHRNEVESDNILLLYAKVCKQCTHQNELTTIDAFFGSIGI